MNDANEKKRGLLQLHLSSCVLLMLTASVLLCLDLMLYEKWDDTKCYFREPISWVYYGAFHVAAMLAVAIANEWRISSRQWKE